MYQIPLTYSVVLRWLQSNYKQLYSVTEHKGEYFKYMFIKLKRDFGTGCSWSHCNCDLKKKIKFLSPGSALGFDSKLDAADAHRIHSSKKSPDPGEGGVEVESSPLTVCNVYERGGKTTKEAFLLFALSILFSFIAHGVVIFPLISRLVAGCSCTACCCVS